MPPLVDLSGHRFGRLLVLYRDENGKCGKVRWRCLCDCGQETVVFARGLTSGNTTSCGCFRSEFMTNQKTTHGMANTRLYRAWVNMRNRCNYTKDKFYPDYGGRGIKVCDEWQQSFEAFEAWAMANGYEDHLSIDRIDNGGNYCPENCRWTTMAEQAKNKRNNHYITHNGETHTVAEWARITGLNLSTIHRRLNKGWTIEQVLRTR